MRTDSRPLAGAFQRWARFSAKARDQIVLLALLLAFLSAWLALRLPVDAIPDLSDPQVIVRARWPGQAPSLIEEQLAYPLASRLLAVPGVKAVRAFAMFGDAFLYALFEDDADLRLVRSRVLEALAQAGPELPPGARVELGPAASGLGWVYQYALVDRSGRHDLADLTALQDWWLARELRAIPGVAEIARVGGMERRFEAIVDPLALRAYGIGWGALSDAVRAASREQGGGVVELAERGYPVTMRGLIRSLSDLAQVPTGVLHEGTPVLLERVAEIREGPAPRQGIAELDGEGEVVGGIVVMQQGANPRELIEQVKQRLERLKPALPEGVEILTVYDRSALIERAIAFLARKLIEELLMVALVCVIFLGALRSALPSLILLPLGVLIALAGVALLGFSADIMALAGIALAIGAMVDSSLVMTENACRRLESWPQGRSLRERREAVAEAAGEVAPALFVSLLIIALSFLPVLLLTGQEGRLFSPLAWTKTLAMLAAAVLALAFGPALIAWSLRRAMVEEERHWLTGPLIRLYRPALRLAIAHPKSVLALAALLVLLSLWPWSRLGSEFLPELEEGDLLYMPSTVAGLSPSKAAELLQQTSRLIRELPEVERVFGKIGRAESATDPAPLTMIETTILLKPKAAWREGLDHDQLIAELDQRVRLPGLVNAWVQPIRTRIEMQSTGIRTPLALRLLGDDLVTLNRLAEEAEAVLKALPGTRSAFAERMGSQPYLELRPDRLALARHGLSMEDFAEWVASAIGGEPLATAYVGRARYAVALRLPHEFRDSPEALAELILPTPSGIEAPLSRLAEIAIREGPAMIRSENARLAVHVFIDPEPGDLLGYVARAERALREQLRFPPGVSHAFTGQYEHWQRASERLSLAAPLVLIIIAALLRLIFAGLGEVLIVLLSLPLALSGSVLFMWLLAVPVSVASIVGLLALAGVAAEFGVIMLLYLERAVSARAPRDRDGLLQALEEGAVRRVRPKAMTVLTLLAGLTPMLFSEGVGAAMLERLVVPMVGGMLSAPLLSLFVIPAAYRLLLEARLRRSSGGA